MRLSLTVALGFVSIANAAESTSTKSTGSASVYTPAGLPRVQHQNEIVSKATQKKVEALTPFFYGATAIGATYVLSRQVGGYQLMGGAYMVTLVPVGVLLMLSEHWGPGAYAVSAGLTMAAMNNNYWGPDHVSQNQLFGNNLIGMGVVVGLPIAFSAIFPSKRASTDGTVFFPSLQRETLVANMIRHF